MKLNYSSLPVKHLGCFQIENALTNSCEQEVAKLSEEIAAESQDLESPWRAGAQERVSEYRPCLWCSMVPYLRARPGT